MMTLAGLLRPWEGAITLDGQDVTKATAEQRAAFGIALVPEGRRHLRDSLDRGEPADRRDEPESAGWEQSARASDRR